MLVVLRVPRSPSSIVEQMMTDLVFEPMHVVAERIAGRELSPVEVTEAVLEQVEQWGEPLNPFITRTPNVALQMARAAEEEIMSGRYRGLLHGIPIVLKDLLATAGIRTTGGSRVLVDWVPEEDATVVRLLREAGAVFVGKTNMPEFAVMPTSTNPFYGPVRNPWNLDHDTAGSSSGTAAALAAGMGYAGPGSDTGGSIRMPASACGIVGLKPTWGRVSLKGVLPLCVLHDHVGPMARTVRDAAILMQVLAGYDPVDPYARDVPVDDYVTPLEEGIEGLRIAVLVDDGGGEIDSRIRAAVDAGIRTLEAAGSYVDEVSLPQIYRLIWDVIPVLEESETAADYTVYLRDRPQELSPGFREFAERGLRYSGVEVQRARRQMLNELHQVERALRHVDLVASPTLGIFPPNAGEECLELLRFTNLWDVNGWPAISVPIGVSDERLPIGLQIVGRPWHEALVLRAARVIEREHALAFPPDGMTG